MFKVKFQNRMIL